MIDRVSAFLGRIPQDKCMHYITGQVGAGLLLALTKSIGWSALGVFLVALWWEVRRLQDPHHHADPLDVLATVVGGVPLYLLFLVVR